MTRQGATPSVARLLLLVLFGLGAVPSPGLAEGRVPSLVEMSIEDLMNRLEIGTAAWMVVTGFVGRYDHRRTQEVAAPSVEFVPSPHLVVTTQFGNQLKATTRGLEVAGHWTPMPVWRLEGSYTAFRLMPQLSASSQDPLAATEDGSAPRTRWQVRSAFSPAPRATVNVALFHSGPLEQFQVAAYTRADITAEWRFSGRLSVMAIGQNLVDATHAEFGGPGTFLLVTQVPRSASLRLRWTFGR